MQKPSLYVSILASLLVTAVISSSILPARAAIYLPAVAPGEFAQYKLLYYNCDATDPSFCQMDTSDFENLDWGALRVVEVSGTSVTLSMIAVYKNGTATQDGALVDVATGFSNVTSFGSSGPTNYFVLAGSLQADDPVWNTPNAPILNETVTKTVLGVLREVNFLNFTSSYSYGGFSISSSSGFAFDRESGVFIEVAFSFSTTGPFGSSQIEFAIGMVDNNIWLVSSLPDFSLDADPTTVSVNEGSPGTSTITITRTGGFARTVTLTATSSPDVLSCSLSPTSLSGSTDTSTLSCMGSPGTYTVTVTADGGYTSHERSVVFNVAASTTPDFAVSNSGPITFQAGSSGTTTITLAALNGFSSTVSLAVSSTPSSLTCSLDKNSIAGAGSATLTCQGQPGTYTVTITASSGYTTRTTQTTVTVNTVTTPSQPASQQIPVLYIGSGVAAAIIIIIVLAALLLLRRKPEETEI